MVETSLRIASLLLAAGLFGGMLLFAGGFAAFLFTALPAEQARVLIRRAFPPFYLVVIIAAAVAALATWAVDARSAAWLLAIALSTVPARQVLMPAINRATDTGARARFAQLHGLSVLVTLLHIGIAGMVVVRLAG